MYQANGRAVRPLTESGLLAALTVALALAAVYLPVLGMVALVCWPLPIIVLVVRRGLRYGIMAVLVSAVLMAMLIEPLLSLRLVLSFGLTGLVLGYGFHRGWSGTRVFAAGFASSVAAKLLAIALLFWVTAINPFQMQLDMLSQAFDASFQLYSELGIDAASLSQSREQVEQGLHVVSLLLPLIVVIMGLIDTVVGFALGGRILRRLGTEVPSLPPFAEWRLPPALLYVFGFALVGLYWGSSRDVTWLYELSLNAEVLAILAGPVQGLSLPPCVIHHFRLATFFRIVIYVLVLMNGVLAQILAFTGLVDMVFDYRRRLRR